MSIQNTCHDRTIICIEPLVVVLYMIVVYIPTHYIVQKYYNRTFIIYIYIDPLRKLIP